MQVKFIGRRIKGFVAVADLALYWGMICKSAEERYKILAFWERHGLSATQEAFDVSRRTLFAWQAQLRGGQGRPHSLAPRLTRPKRLRQRSWPQPLIDQIRSLRKAHPNLGKEKLHVLLKPFRHAHSLSLPLAPAPSDDSSLMRRTKCATHPFTLALSPRPRTAP